MIVHQHDSSTEASPRRGEQFGRRFAPAIARAVGLYRDWFAVSAVPHRRSRTLLTVLFDGVTGGVEYLAGHPAQAAVEPMCRICPPPA